MLSAALHLVGTVLSGFSPVGLFLIGPAVLYLALAAGVSRGWLWTAWIALICMLGGMAGTVAELMAASTVPDWVLWGILGADLGAALVLFGGLWAGRAAQEA